MIKIIKSHKNEQNLEQYFSQSKPIMQGFSMRTSRKKDLQWLFNTHDNLCFNVCQYCNGWTQFEIINILMTFHDINKYCAVALLARVPLTAARFCNGFVNQLSVLYSTATDNCLANLCLMRSDANIRTCQDVRVWQKSCPYVATSNGQLISK